MSDRNHCEALQRDAAAAMRSGDHQLAVHLLKEAATTGQADDVVWLQLAAAYRSTSDLQRALEAAETAMQIAPTNLMALLMVASLRNAVGSVDRAIRTYREALRLASKMGPLPEMIRQQLDGARELIAQDDAWRQSVFGWDVDAASPNLSNQERERIDGFREGLLRNAEAGAETSSAFNFPGLEASAYHDPADFPGVTEVAEQTEVVTREFMTLAQIHFRSLFDAINASGRRRKSRKGASGSWSMIPLLRKGLPRPEYSELCPRTIALHGKIESPTIGSVSPSLYFSVLEPRTRIAPHIGVSNARLIVHWPLLVPGDCGIRVGKEQRSWRPGEAMVFDDMIEHEAWNDSDEVRVVLIGDVWHPGLSRAERSAISTLMRDQLAG